MNQACKHDIAGITELLHSSTPSDLVRILLTVPTTESNLILCEHHL